MCGNWKGKIFVTGGRGNRVLKVDLRKKEDERPFNFNSRGFKYVFWFFISSYGSRELVDGTGFSPFCSWLVIALVDFIKYSCCTLVPGWNYVLTVFPKNICLIESIIHEVRLVGWLYIDLR